MIQLAALPLTTPTMGGATHTSNTHLMSNWVLCLLRFVQFSMSQYLVWLHLGCPNYQLECPEYGGVFSAVFQSC